MNCQKAQKYQMFSKPSKNCQQYRLPSIQRHCELDTLIHMHRLSQYKYWYTRNIGSRQIIINELVIYL